MAWTLRQSSNQHFWHKLHLSTGRQSSHVQRSRTRVTHCISRICPTFYGASVGKGVNYVSPNDSAEVAVRALLEPRAHRNKEYTLTVWLQDNATAPFRSHHLQKPVMYVDQPMHTYDDGEKMGGKPQVDGQGFCCPRENQSAWP